MQIYTTWNKKIGVKGWNNSFCFKWKKNGVCRVTKFFYTKAFPQSSGFSFNVWVICWPIELKCLVLSSRKSLKVTGFSPRSSNPPDIYLSMTISITTIIVHRLFWNNHILWSLAWSRPYIICVTHFIDLFWGSLSKCTTFF